MGIVKRAADLAYTFRFVRMLVLDWKDWDAYKLGIIDENGKRIKSEKLDTDEKKSAYTSFIRLCANIKRLVSAIPGGSTKLGSFASALFLVKENYSLSDKEIQKILEKIHFDHTQILAESTEWFVLDDGQLSPGMYRLKEDKLLSESLDDIVYAKDQVKVSAESYPVGDVFGIDIYEATHVKTNMKVFITTGEIYK